MQRSLFEAEGLIPLVVECVVEGVADELDQAHSERAATYSAAAFELARARTVRRVFSALLAHDIQFLVLKGASLAYLVYDEPWHRTRNDTDILIRDSDKSRVFNLLGELGFEAQAVLPGPMVMAECAFMLTDELSLEHTVDVHWRINNNWRLAALTTFEELCVDRMSVPQMPDGTFTCRPHWAILIAAMHRCAHLNYPAYEIDGFKRVEADFTLWTYDVHLLSQQLTTNDWDTMAQLATERGFGILLWVMLRRSQMLFDTSIPLDIMARLSQSQHQLPADAFSGSIRASWQSFSAIPGVAPKASYLWQQLLPPRDYMRDQFGPGFLPLQYLSRLFSGLLLRVQQRQYIDAG